LLRTWHQQNIKMFATEFRDRKILWCRIWPSLWYRFCSTGWVLVLVSFVGIQFQTDVCWMSVQLTCVHNNWWNILCSNQTLVSIGGVFSSSTGDKADDGCCESNDCEPSPVDVSESSRSFTSHWNIQHAINCSSIQLIFTCVAVSISKLWSLTYHDIKANVITPSSDLFICSTRGFCWQLKMETIMTKLC